MRLLSFSILLALSIGFIACSSSNSTSGPSNMKTNQKMELSNKEKAVALLTSLETGDQQPVSYINPTHYVQHNLGVADGLEGFGAVLSNPPKGGFKAKVVRAFQDGDYVVTHTQYDFFGLKVGFDIFRFEDGKIVEHWDNLQEIVTETASGRTQLDGPTAVTDVEKTAANKALVNGFVTDILMGGAPNKITDYVSTTTYHQHNPGVKDGLSGLGEAIEALTKAGMPMRYDKHHITLGEGNFVLTVSEGEFMKKQVSFYDLFRIEGGKIVEHWDAIEEIPAKEMWKNQNGKFGFK